MPRATYVGVLKRYGGTPPPGWDETAITGLFDAADDAIDGYTAPDTISTTDSIAVAIAEIVVMRLVKIGDAGHQASGTSGLDGRAYPDYPELSDELKERIDSLLIDPTLRGIGIADMIPE